MPEGRAGMTFPCHLALVIGVALVQAQEANGLQKIWQSIQTSAVRIEVSTATPEARNDVSGGSAGRSFFAFSESTNHTLGEYESRACRDLRWILESGARGAEWCSQLTVQGGWFSDCRSPGRHSRQAGWVLFSMDTLGVWAFGGHSLTAVLVVLLVSLFTYGFGLIARPFQGLWRVLRRLGGVRAPNAVEEFLPPSASGSTRCVHWYGVGPSRPLDTSTSRVGGGRTTSWLGLTARLPA